MDETGHSPLSDEAENWRVVDSTIKYHGAIVDVREDEIETPDGDRHRRDVIEHRGAVAVVAVDDDRVLLVHQYRHPVEARLVELPAGLLDEDGEAPLATAKRELAEEASLAAEKWSELVEVATSPGVSDERVLIYLAEGVSTVNAPDGFTAHGEEASMTTSWVPVDEVVEAILARRICDGLLIAGVLALVAKHTSRSSDE
jgi:8-oxo-dGDP phosphatase